MKKLILGCCIAVALVACSTDTGSEANHFSMVVDGTYLEADTTATTYFVWVPDSGLGIYGAGGTVIYNAIQLYGVAAPGIYPIISNGFPEAGLRFQQSADIYYINETHGNGSLTLEIFDVSPGIIHRLKGTFEGTAATDSGQTVTITQGIFSYTEP